MTSYGKLQVYTGSGKGKTTASLGLSLRVIGAGGCVYYAQFIKDGKSSEFKAMAEFGEKCVCRHYGRGSFVRRLAGQEDIAHAQRGLAECSSAIRSGDYQLVVLDEANCAVNAGLFTIDELLTAIEPHENTEIVITGRNAHPELLAKADLITVMQAEKHYAEDNCNARRGIEF